MFLEDVEESWDLVVIGGGITGAGILLEAARAGLRALLLEQRDFAWGTSGRSSKLVHGGLRYIRDGHLMLTRVSVRERERLLREAAGLVEPLEFVIPIYDGHKLGKKALGFALTIYSILAHKRQHVYLEAAELRERASLLVSEGLQGGFQYLDARVDDARLVLRVIQEAESLGACALNYCAVTEVRRSRAGKMRGVGVRDVETGVERSFSSPVVINATGAWAESLHPCPEPGRRIRPLRLNGPSHWSTPWISALCSLSPGKVWWCTGPRTWITTKTFPMSRSSVLKRRGISWKACGIFSRGFLRRSASHRTPA
ncbi:MAG: FAD-dependent oxidoreductase [Deltaproteobacteria bacterium]|nr:FAD-dependent oxidoreductase [Deltaproteobacteria bacterium]